MTPYRFLPAILLTLVLCTAGTTTALGQDEKPVSDDEVNAVASQLYCPICENVPLDVCSSQACADWRELIRDFLAQGWTPDQIKEYFSTQYGWNVLTIPPPIGINWSIYVAPPMIIIAGIITVLVLIKRSNKFPMTIRPSTNKIANNTLKELLDQVEKDLEDEEKHG